MTTQAPATSAAAHAVDLHKTYGVGAAAVHALAGVTVNHVEWALTEATRATQEAEVLRRAVVDARSRAQAMATAAGQGEVRWVELADPGLLQGGARPTGAETYTATAMRAGKADAGGGTDVVPEDIAWQVQVHARFAAG